MAALPLAERYFADSIKAQIDRDGVVSVSSVEVGLLERRVTVRELRPKLGNGMSAVRWEASGLSWPLEEILKGHTPLVVFRVGDPLRAQRVEADDLKISNANGQTWRFGSVVVEGIDLQRFDADVPVGPFQSTILGARLAQALSVRRIEERNAIYVEPVTQNTIGFLSGSATGYDHGKLGSFSFNGIEATAKASVEPSFKLGSLKGEGLDLRQIVNAMSEASWRPGLPMGRVVIDKASASGFGGEVFARYGISLGSVTIDTAHEGDTVARSIVKVDGFVMVPPVRGLEGLQMRLAMQAMGLKDLRLGLECSAREDRAKGEAAIDRCTLSGPELGELTFDGKIVGADAQFWRAIDTSNLMALYGSKAAFGAATLSLADKGLLDRAMRGLALASSQAPATARANLATEIRRYQPPNVLITEDLTKLLETTARFIEKGGTLTIEARPDPPFALDKFALLMRPGPDLVSLLGLAATLSK